MNVSPETCPLDGYPDEEADTVATAPDATGQPAVEALEPSASGQAAGTQPAEDVPAEDVQESAPDAKCPRGDPWPDAQPAGSSSEPASGAAPETSGPVAAQQVRSDPHELDTLDRAVAASAAQTEQEAVLDKELEEAFEGVTDQERRVAEEGVAAKSEAAGSETQLVDAKSVFTS